MSPPTVNCLLPIVFSMPIVHSVSIVHCLLSTVYHPLSSVCQLPSVCLLSIACLLSIVYCLPSIIILWRKLSPIVMEAVKPHSVPSAYLYIVPPQNSTGITVLFVYCPLLIVYNVSIVHRLLSHPRIVLGLQCGD